MEAKAGSAAATAANTLAPPPANGGLHRVLKARHLSMIAIGGSIGTGLFVA